MIDIFVGCKQYIQRGGILAESGNLLKNLGQRPMVLGDELVLSITRPTLEDRMSAAGLSPSFVLFGEECSLNEISRLVEIVRKENLDFIVGTIVSIVGLGIAGLGLMINASVSALGMKRRLESICQSPTASSQLPPTVRLFGRLKSSVKPKASVLE